MDDKSCLVRSARTTVTADSTCRHPFTNTIIEVPLLEKWKGFNRNRYDGSTDPDEHMDAYTTHMSLYTSDDAVLCRVFPTSLKGATLSWFTKLSPNSIDSFATLVAKFETQFATNRHTLPTPLSARSGWSLNRHTLSRSTYQVWSRWSLNRHTLSTPLSRLGLVEASTGTPRPRLIDTHPS